eukprot:5605463-Karenia_brevis.AAC.1
MPDLEDNAKFHDMKAFAAKPNLWKKAQQWIKEHLFVRGQRGQELRQNHVHIWNDKRQAYMPLTHCQ